jgi:hypothetical protein
MDLTVAQEACVLQAGNEPQHAGLLGEFQMILESDEVVAVGT